MLPLSGCTRCSGKRLLGSVGWIGASFRRCPQTWLLWRRTQVRHFRRRSRSREAQPPEPKLPVFLFSLRGALNGEDVAVELLFDISRVPRGRVRSEGQILEPDVVFHFWGKAEASVPFGNNPTPALVSALSAPTRGAGPFVLALDLRIGDVDSEFFCFSVWSRNTKNKSIPEAKTRVWIWFSFDVWDQSVWSSRQH